MSRPSSLFQFRPRVETLESRRCLAGTFLTPIGDLLIIRGDETDNQLAIVDAGAAGGGVWVTLDGPAPHLFEGIRRIMVDLGGGADFFDAQLGGPDTLVKKLTVNLGAGEDHFSLQIDDLAGRALAVSVAGQGDDDLIGFHWGVMEGSLSLAARGGDGNDNIFIGDPGILIGSLSVMADGGNGDDEVGMIIYGIEGNANVMANGGAGDDAVGIVIEGGKFGSLNISTNGGSGDDVLTQDLLQMDANVMLACLGGLGNDIISQKVELADSESGLARTIKVTGDGGAGNDTLAIETTRLPGAEPRTGIPTEMINVAAKGGAGDDLIDWIFHGGLAEDHIVLQARIEGADGDDQVGVMFDATPNPELHVLSLLGGNGDDQLGIILQSEATPAVAALLWVVDGGAGYDEALVPRGLRTRRCELVLPPG